MPDMPMPPIPTKWMGPSWLGNFMRNLRYWNKNCQRPAVSSASSASLSAASGTPALLAASARRVKSFGSASACARRSASHCGREPGLAHDVRSAGFGEMRGVGGLVGVERVRERHENGRAPDHRQFRHGRGAGAADHQMRCRHARRQIGEERRHIGVHFQPGIGALDAGKVLAARLLHDDETGALLIGQQADGGGNHIRHDARPLRAAGDEKAQLVIGETREGQRRRRDHRRAHRIAHMHHLARAARPKGPRFRGSREAMTFARLLRNLLARPMTAFCSCRISGTPRKEAASAGGTVGIAAKTHDRARLDLAKQGIGLQHASPQHQSRRRLGRQRASGRRRRTRFHVFFRPGKRRHIAAPARRWPAEPAPLARKAHGPEPGRERDGRRFPRRREESGYLGSFGGGSQWIASLGAAFRAA